jgi:hypothetical protein
MRQHEPGCPAIADDESDEVLFDYGVCVCSARDHVEYEGICDGCAQSVSECLCDVNLDDVLDCNHPFHPGCRKCEQR